MDTLGKTGHIEGISTKKFCRRKNSTLNNLVKITPNIVKQLIGM